MLKVYSFAVTQLLFKRAEQSHWSTAPEGEDASSNPATAIGLYWPLKWTSNALGLFTILTNPFLLHIAMNNRTLRCLSRKETKGADQRLFFNSITNRILQLPLSWHLQYLIQRARNTILWGIKRKDIVARPPAFPIYTSFTHHTD